MAVLKLADIGDELVDEDYARGVGGEERLKDFFAGGGAGGVGFLDERKGFLAAELPGQFAPEGADELLAVLPRLARGVSVAIENGDAGSAVGSGMCWMMALTKGSTLTFSSSGEFTK